MTRKFLSVLSILGILFSTMGMPLTAVAAQYTGVKDTMSTQALNTTATHTMQWTLVGNSFDAADTFVVDFTTGDFDFNAAASWEPDDFAFTDSVGARSIVAAGASPSCSNGANNLTVTVNDTDESFTITACTGFTSSSTTSNITFIAYGTAATGAGTITNKNSDVNDSQFSVTGTGGDTASGALVVETNDVVNVTATVSPTLTFSNSDATIEFGTLSSVSAKYADNAAGDTSRAVAHTIAIGTNATTGYTLTYSGATLTSGGNTIAAATIVNDANGDQNQSQFALGGTETGDGSMTSGYDLADGPDWKFVAGSAQTIASASGVVSSSSIALEYVANIIASQAAGSYSTDLTYVVTGNF